MIQSPEPTPPKPKLGLTPPTPDNSHRLLEDHHRPNVGVVRSFIRDVEATLDDALEQQDTNIQEVWDGVNGLITKHNAVVDVVENFSKDLVQLREAFRWFKYFTEATAPRGRLLRLLAVLRGELDPYRPEQCCPHGTRYSRCKMCWLAAHEPQDPPTKVVENFGP